MIRDNKVEAEIIDIMRHSLGLKDGDVSYRNYYCSESTPSLEIAVKRGWMIGPREIDWMCAPYWHVTEVGVELIEKTDV